MSHEAARKLALRTLRFEQFNSYLKRSDLKPINY